MGYLDLVAADVICFEHTPEPPRNEHQRRWSQDALCHADANIRDCEIAPGPGVACDKELGEDRQPGDMPVRAPVFARSVIVEGVNAEAR
jgi:hypothetical protein